MELERGNKEVRDPIFLELLFISFWHLNCFEINMDFLKILINQDKDTYKFYCVLFTLSK